MASSLTLAALAACGPQEASSDTPEQPDVLALLASDAKGSLQKTMDTTSKATSVTITMEITTEGKTQKGHGVVALGGPLKADITIEDAEDGPTTVRMLDTVFYVQLPEKDRADMGGKQWMKMDLGATGADTDELSRQFEDIDPTKQLRSMLAGENVTVVGEEQVGGVKTVHYTVTTQATSYLKQLDAKQRKSVEKELGKAGVAEVKTDLWVDEQYQLRRAQLVMGKLSDVTVDYSDYGKPVTIEAPPASETADFEELLKGLKTGG